MAVLCVLCPVCVCFFLTSSQDSKNVDCQAPKPKYRVLNRLTHEHVQCRFCVITAGSMQYVLISAEGPLCHRVSLWIPSAPPPMVSSVLVWNQIKDAGTTASLSQLLVLWALTVEHWCHACPQPAAGCFKGKTNLAVRTEKYGAFTVAVLCCGCLEARHCGAHSNEKGSGYFLLLYTVCT